MVEGVISFGRFRLDLAQRELRRDKGLVRIVKLTAPSEKGMKRSKRSHCRDRVAPLVGCLGSEGPQRGA